MPENGDGDGGAAGGSGKNAGTSSASGLANLAITLNEVVQIAKALDTIDGFTTRSVVCEIDNVCGRTLNFESSNSNYGGFGSNLPPVSIADQKTGLFGAGSSGILVGVEGHVTYVIDDGQGSRFIAHFDNPEAGGNSSDCSVESSISSRYFTSSVTGNGNTGAHMRFVVGTLNPPFSLRTFLINTLGVNPTAPGTSVRSISSASPGLRSFMKI